MTDPRRNLPSVDRLLADAGVQTLLARFPRSIVVRAVREQIDAARDGRAGPAAEWVAEITDRCLRFSQPSLRPVLNATGVVLHTNLGRAPLAEAALAAMTGVATSYSTLEFDLASGSRGHRSDHARHLLAELTGAAD
ncbi:MAG TPA: hypothetical protein VMJ30_06075, partial [Gemmatimonadales bacterium]|nr:hypothetical protein [Gemmatimonadales bacterium]